MAHATPNWVAPADTRIFRPFPTTASALSRQLHAQAEQDFAGLQGSVLVGPLQRVQDRVDTATLKPRGAAGDAAHDGGH